MSLIVFGHPFSSYTQKVLIALYENKIPFEFRLIEPDQQENSAEWLRRWPLRKFPLLVDEDTQVAETSIIIEYLGLMYPGPVPLLPADPQAALPVRFMDRFFDLHVMNAMQYAVDGALGINGVSAAPGRATAEEKLIRAYGWLEEALSGHDWAVGNDFTMADCAAAPSLFYADWVLQIGPDYPQLAAYRARLLARPSVARAVEGGRPYRHYFPLGAPNRD